MLDKVMRLAVVLSAVDHLTEPLRKGVRAIEELDRAAGKTEKLRKLGEDMQSFGKQALIASAVAGAALAVPIRAFAQLENATSNARVAFMVAGGAVDPLFEKIERVAIELGNLLPGTTRDMMELAAAMKVSGLEADVIANGALEAAAKFRVLEGQEKISAAQAGETIALYSQALGITKEIVPLIDLVSRGRGAFGLDLMEFTDTLKYYGPIAKTIGAQGFDSARGIIAFAGALSQAGIKGRTLGVVLRGTMLELPNIDDKIKKSGEISALFNQKGIQFKFFDARGTFLGFENFIGQLEKLRVLSQQEQLTVLKEIFGDQAAPALALVVQKGVAGYREALSKLEGQASLNERMAEILDQLSNKWDAATGTLSNLLAAIGASIAPLLKVIVDVANTGLGWLTAFVQKHQTLTAVVMGAVGAFALISFALGAVAIALGTFIVWMTVARSVGLLWKATLWITRASLLSLIGTLARVTAATWSWTAALLANPIGAIALGVVALATATLLLWRNWRSVSAFIKANPLFSGVLAFLSPITALLTGSIAIVKAIARLDLSHAGRQMVNSLWVGMQSLAHKPIELMRRIAGKLRALLPFSPAKEGPLRDLHRIRIIETIAFGMQPWPMVNAMRRAALLTAAALLPVAGAFNPALAGAVSLPQIAQLERVGLRRSANATAPMSFTYAPVLHIAAGTPAETVSAVRRLLDADRAELERLVADLARASAHRDERKGQGKR